MARRCLLGLVANILIAGCSTAPEVEPGAPVPAATAAQRVRRTVTLITGDRVALDDTGKVTTAPGPGRGGITFLQQRVAGHVLVIPSDAVSPLRTGTLDRRLFDITALLDANLDRRRHLPLIVQHAGARGASFAAAAPLLGPADTVVAALPIARAVAIRSAPDGALWKAFATGRTQVTKIWLDGARRRTLDASVPQIGAPAAWAAGYDGTGVRVAVLDSGIDGEHPDLVGKVVASHNFLADDPDQPEDALDHDGHGTHIASTIAGSGAASGGTHRGVAPGAELLDGKVCGSIDCPDSALLAGIQWAIDEGAQVINLSLGDYDTPEIDPLEEAVNTATAEHGVLFVVAAGNDGVYGRVASPGSADAALTVAAFDKERHVASFSSRGPRVGDDGLKPDLAAPGVDISAARSQYASDGQPGDLYLTLSGTSMATPHVAGAAAILLQQRPELAPAELKAVLMGSARPQPGVDPFAQGTGEVDLARAIAQPVSVSPASVSFGMQRYPHDDDERRVATVVYANASPFPIRLALEVQAATLHGDPAPAELFVVPPSIEVPAHGTVAVEVACDTRVGEATGLFAGTLTATADNVSLRTSLAVNREVESYDVDVTVLDRAGQAAADFDAFLYIPHALEGFAAVRSSSETLRLREGPYQFMAWIRELPEVDGEVAAQTLLGSSTFEVTGHGAMTIDARIGRPVAVTVPDPAAAIIGAEVSIAHNINAQVGSVYSIEAPTFGGIHIGNQGATSDPANEAAIASGWAYPGADGQFANSPVLYSLVWWFDRLPEGFVRAVRTRDLAVVKADYASQTLGETTAYIDVWSNGADNAETRWWSSPELEVTLPHRRTEYFNTEHAVSWVREFSEYAGDIMLGTAREPDRTYRPGRHVYRGNRAVFAPGFARIDRDGDALTVWISPFGVGSQLHYKTRLYREGTLVLDEDGTHDFGVFHTTVVPPEDAAYEVEVEAERATDDVVSPRVTASWTFRSKHTAEYGEVGLPIVRIAPPGLDERQTAPCGRAFSFPLGFFTGPWPEDPAVRLARRPSVEVSYDEGAHWRHARVTGDVDGGFTVHVEHPRRADSVSLRVDAVAATGERTTQTLYRAYRLR